MKIKSGLVAFFTMLATIASAQAQEVEMADAMRANGKIYVVVGIILIVLVGLIAYLFVMDRKVSKLERMISEKPSKLKP